MESLLFAVRAYETAPEGTVTTPLADYCASQGLEGTDLADLTAMPGPTDLGRLESFMARISEPAPELVPEPAPTPPAEGGNDDATPA